MLGSLTLLVEAKANHNSFASMHTIHLNCRLVQGFLGAFLFFYAYLLAATAFEGRQQVPQRCWLAGEWPTGLPWHRFHLTFHVYCILIGPMSGANGAKSRVPPTHWPAVLLV